MRINENGNVVSVRFDSLADLLTTDYQNKGNEKIIDGYKRGTWNLSFINARSGDEVIQKAVNGDAECLRVLEALQKRLDRNKKEPQHKFSNEKKRKRVRVRRQMGDELDIHKVYQGNLDQAWTLRKKELVEVNQKLYTIMIDVGGLANVNFETTLWRGVVAYQVAGDLITSGKAVKIIVGASANGVIKQPNDKRGHTVTTDIIVKNFNEPLSMERLAAMSNIGFHRVFNFMSRAMLPYDISSGMGFTSRYLESKGPIEDTGIEQDTSKYIYIGQNDSLQGALSQLERIYGNL